MFAGDWWREGVIYQAYPRSFQDSNADGIGDLGGVIDRLDYLQWLGVDAVWLNPITVSPDADFGYDVADYCRVQPVFGDLRTTDELIAQAAKRDIKIVLDIVPNHSSDRHPWFIDARSSRTSKHRDWYVWADPKPDGGPPNNWLSAMGGPAWTLDTRTGQYYLHNFLPQQPDLNWWNPDVRDAFDDIYRFWYDRGVAGFRIDVAHTKIASCATIRRQRRTIHRRFAPTASAPSTTSSGWKSMTSSAAGARSPTPTTPHASCWARPMSPTSKPSEASMARATN